MSKLVFFLQISWLRAAPSAWNDSDVMYAGSGEASGVCFVYGQVFIFAFFASKIDYNQPNVKNFIRFG